MTETFTPPDSPPDRNAGRTPEPPSATELLEVLGDEYARRLLQALADRPRGGRELARDTDMSRATVYRRLEEIEEAGLVRSEMVADPDGHHHQRFEPTLHAATVELRPDGLETTVQQRDADPVEPGLDATAHAPAGD